MSSINNIVDTRHSSTSIDPRLTLVQIVYQPCTSPSTGPGQQMRRASYCPRRKIWVKFITSKRGFPIALRNAKSPFRFDSFQSNSSYSNDNESKSLDSEWTTICDFLLLSWLNLFPHTSHEKGFSPVWTSICLRRLDCHGNHLPQRGHVRLSGLFVVTECLSTTQQQTSVCGWQATWVIWLRTVATVIYCSSIIYNSKINT